ncbi:MAG: VOC family protein [Xanthomonadales bacterium]|nr:VOC family protein [Xanthomonadales bacterium]
MFPNRFIHQVTPLSLLPFLLWACLAGAAPVAEDQRVPIDLRRTTLVVADIDRSLAFYRDALGMTVVYDNKIRSPRSAASDDEAERVSRLVFLQANDDFVGVLGLLEYQKPRKPEPATASQPFSIGTTVKVFNLENLEQQFEQVRGIAGVTIISEPSPRNYPSYDGKSTIPVLVSIVTDPDGFVVELNQLLVESVR